MAATEGGYAGAGAFGRWGIARTYALIFGIAYIAVALLEDILGGSGLKIGDATILKLTALQNVIHWATGLVVLGSFFAGENVARMVARVVGIIFVVVSLWGIISPTSLGEFLGFDGGLPLSYNIVHIATAALALFAGFAASRVYGRGAATA